MRRTPLLRIIAACLTYFFVVASTQSDCEAVEAILSLSATVALDQDKIDSLDGNVQRLLDCLPSGATLNLEVSTLTLAFPLVINKPVSLGADGAPSVITCGEKGDGALAIRSDDVLLSNISIMGCRLNQTSAPLEIFGAKNVTVKDVRCLENTNSNGAGCMHVEASTVELHNITAESNRGWFGGALRIVGGKATISGSLFRSNNASGSSGAGMFLQASPVVEIADSVFEGNHAEGSGGGLAGSQVKRLKLSGVDFLENSADFFGGALDVKGQEGKATVEIRSTNFLRNGLGEEKRNTETAPSGGAIAFRNVSDVSITKSTFTLGQAHQGGAIFSQYSRASKGMLKIKGSTFTGNKVATTSEYVNPSGLVSGSRGGAVYIKGGEVEVESCKFESNSARESTEKSSYRSAGGAIFLTSEDSTANITVSGDTDFIKNSAPFGGAIFAERFILEIHRGTYKKNDGGAIHLEGGRLRSLANITDAAFNSNKQGGVFLGYSGGDQSLEVSFHRCRFFNNVSPDKGGAIHMRAPKGDTIFAGASFSLGVYDSMFLSNKAGRPDGNDPSSLVDSVDGQGGALFLEGEKAFVELVRVQFSENVAGIGGAISATSLSDVFIRDSRFFGGQALKGGGIAVFDAQHQSMVISDVVFLNNTAQEGGAVFVEGKERTLYKPQDIDLEWENWPGQASVLPPISFSRVLFNENEAVGGGGGIDIRREHVTLFDCNFSRNRLIDSAAGGGALRVTDFSKVDLFTTSIESSFAGSGGGVYVEDSCLSGVGLTLKNNTAFNNGGAIAAYLGPTLSCEGLFPLSIVSSSIVGNTARVGGGLHAVVASGMAVNCSQSGAPPSNQQVLFKYLADCTGKEVEIFKNRQTLVGDTEITKNDALDNGPAIFINDLSKLQVCCGLPSSCVGGGDIKRTPCEIDDGGLTWKRNKGRDSSVGGVATTIRDVNVSPKIIKGHASGRLMRNIKISPMDAFLQPAFERATLRVRSLSSDAVLSRSPVATDGVVMAGEFTVTGLVLKAQPGIYELLFTLDPEDDFAESLNKTISVIVRECLIGEVSLDGGERCQECGSPFYSFNSSEGSCQVCPKHAVCDGSTLTPEMGFWHHDSHSSHIHKCECVKACDFSDRVDKLSYVSAAMALLHGRAATAADGYAQCNEGFGGALCGSCLPSYGKVRSLDCTACPSTATSRVIIGLILLSLAVVSLIFVKSAARFSEQETSPRAEVSHSVLQNVGLPALPENNLSVEHVPAGSSHSRVHTRASDVVKILVNFLQVTGTAATINVNWTNGVLRLLATMGLFSGISDNTGFLGFECAFSTGGAPRSVKATALMICIPAVVWLSFLVFAASTALRKRKELDQFKTVAFVSLLAVVQVSYISITQRLVRIFYCLDAAPFDDQFWAEDTSVVCYEGWHKLLVAVFGVPLLALITLGFPGGLLLKLSRNRGRLQERQIMSRFGSFYTSYKDTTAFWEVLILLRKALLSTITVFARQLGSGVQGDLSLFVMGASTMLQLQFQPFKDPKLNHMELASLITSTLTFMVGNLIGKTHEDWVRVPLSVLLIAVILIFIGFLLCGIFAAGKNDFKRWIASKTTRGEGALRSCWGFFKDVSEEKLIAVGLFWKQMTRPNATTINRDGEP